MTCAHCVPDKSDAAQFSYDFCINSEVDCLIGGNVETVSNPLYDVATLSKPDISFIKLLNLPNATDATNATIILTPPAKGGLIRMFVILCVCKTNKCVYALLVPCEDLELSPVLRLQDLLMSPELPDVGPGWSGSPVFEFSGLHVNPWLFGFLFGGITTLALELADICDRSNVNQSSAPNDDHAATGIDDEDEELKDGTARRTLFIKILQEWHSKIYIQDSIPCNPAASQVSSTADHSVISQHWIFEPFKRKTFFTMKSQHVGKLAGEALRNFKSALKRNSGHPQPFNNREKILPDLPNNNWTYYEWKVGPSSGKLRLVLGWNEKKKIPHKYGFFSTDHYETFATFKA